MAEVCLHQTQRPLAQITTKGWGNCLTCETDETNKHCAGYWPIKIPVPEAKEEEEKAV